MKIKIISFENLPEYLIHSNLGVVRFTDECLVLQKKEKPIDTLYVSYKGEIRECSIDCISI